ncbi:PadR family transcriptional regulator [Desulfosporosinus sp. FKA]|uniref:PadR family transcriptional regulator n=1 Tax=Desulfosporosinus sp. FKA TaxID=1969834 RepID=UPI000B4A4979|nr:PadR family transcriptional regulator [Desulfosporosinus sp. FKA]
MKIPFYLLNLLLRYGPQLGYRLNKIIEEEISDFSKIKLPTIYYHLDKLKEKEYVTETLDKDRNRPEKFVYSITEMGKEYFNELFINLKKKYVRVVG